MECKEVWSEFWQFPRSNYSYKNQIGKFPVNFIFRPPATATQQYMCVRDSMESFREMVKLGEGSMRGFLSPSIIFLQTDCISSASGHQTNFTPIFFADNDFVFCCCHFSWSYFSFQLEI